jgi:hypothetical protein
MSDAVPVADAMEEAQAVIAADTLATLAAQAEDAPATEASAPVQVPLFEPPPFDFEEAYDELHRLDRRAQNRKSAWESLKGAASDAKKDYDAAIDDLHAKFDEIDTARRVNAARQTKPAETPAAESTTEGGEPQMGEEPEIEQPEPDEVPTPEPEKRDHDAGIGY